MRKNRVVEQNRCYHLFSRLAHRAFFLDDGEKNRAVLLLVVGHVVSTRTLRFPPSLAITRFVK